MIDCEGIYMRYKEDLIMKKNEYLKSMSRSEKQLITYLEPSGLITGSTTTKYETWITMIKKKSRENLSVNNGVKAIRKGHDFERSIYKKLYLSIQSV